MAKQYIVKQGDTLNTMQELPFQTYQRVTGKKWTGGASPEVVSKLKEFGITSAPGSAEANLALQKQLETQQTKQPSIIQTTTASRIQHKNNVASLDNINTNIDNTKTQQATAKLATDTIAAQTKSTLPITDTPATPTVDPQIAIDIKVANDKHTADITSANTQLDNSKSLLKTSNQAIIDNIKSIYSSRLAMMKATNEALLATVTQSGFRSGRARYLQSTQAGILSDTENKGLLRMGQLQGDMLSLISKAENARTAGDYKLLNDHMVAINKIDTQLQDTVQNIQKLAIQKQAEQRLRDTLTLKENQTNIQNGLELSKRYAPSMVNSLDTLKTNAEKIDYIKKVALNIGVDPNILLGDIKYATKKDNKATENIANLQSLISNRKVQTETSKFRAETARLKQDKGKTASGLSVATENIMNNVSTLADVSTKNKEKVKSELKTLGFYDTVPPKWYVEYKNSTSNESLFPTVIKKEWDIYRNKALSISSRSLI